MCDMQKMPTREDASCEEEDMNFAAFSAVGAGGTHFVTTGGQMPVAKLQQNNGNALSQVVGMVGVEGGVQYVRTMDSAAMQTPQLISVPISLPGTKPGDPQPTVQIQVLNPNMLHQQQPKYQMQIPIQGFQQGGAVLTVQYSPEANETGGLQLVGQNTLTESGLQILAALPQEMQLVQQSGDKSQIQSNMHQVFVTPNQQIIINSPGDNKALNNNTSSNNNNTMEHAASIIIKEECDDDSSQGTENSESSPWSISAISNSQQDLVKYLNSLPPQQTQTLPLSLQQFLKLNPTTMDVRKVEPMDHEVEVEEKKDDEAVAEAIIGEDGTVRIQNKKKKKYKKKPPKPARPKPGQVVIATAADGTPIFCCPECQMAYPEKEQLEIHLVVHKIERRFICGICGAGLKRKEHLERHKLGHNPERPFVCGVCRKGFKRREHLNLHTVMHSGVKTEMCMQCGKGFYRKDHLRKHTRSHENKRARDEANADNNALFEVKQAPSNDMSNTILPEITIHVPTSANVQVPVQINIPQHVVTSLAAAQAQQQAQQAQQQAQQALQQAQQLQQQSDQAQLEALLAQHS